MLARLHRLDVNELVAASPTAEAIVHGITNDDAAVREAALGGAHKVRVRVGAPEFSAEELAESRRWLELRGFHA